MRLKRVKIYGFKTFADRTEFDLDGDLIAVVGPNGCGKSNLVDAILWGLGEGSARNLRAQSGQDVIFGGSARRKPIGYAEVTLVFDNEDGSLPFDAPEVAVTRKLNRAGESDYSMNKRPCRLKDIADLLADSGLGRSGYSIVGQREIDQALSASPEERRAWVDEAAGVQRYRARKHEALKRLASAQQHLDRVSDVMAEIDAQREPLREEAEVARRYKSVQGALRSLEVGLLAVEASTATEDVRKAEERLAGFEQLRRQEEKRAEALAKLAEDLSAQSKKLEAAMEDFHSRHRNSLLALQRAESSIQLATERLKALNEQQKSLFEEAGQEERLAQARAEIEAAQKELEAERALLDQVRNEAAGTGQARSRLTADLKDLDARLNLAVSQAAEYARAQAEFKQSEARAREARREAKGIEEDLPEIEKALAEAEADEVTKAAAAAQLDAERSEGEEALARGKSEVEGLQAEIRSRLAEQAALEGRRQGIQATIDAHEGLNAGARAVLESGQAGIRSFAEGLRVEPEFAAALEAALGVAAQDLVADSDQIAIKALSNLAVGRATLRVPGRLRTAKAKLDRSGVLACAADVVQADASLAPVVEDLLGNVAIVAGWEEALRAVRKGGWRAAATLSGDLVEASGAFTGGRSERTGQGLIRRKSELVKIEANLEKLAVEIDALKGREATITQLLAEASAAEAGLREKRKAAERDLADAREWCRKVRSERDETLKSLAKLQAEAARLQQTAPPKAPEFNVDQLRIERERMIAELASHSSDSRHAEDQMRQAEVRLAQAGERLRHAERRLKALEEAEQLRERKLANLGPQQEKLALERAQSERERDDARRDSERAAQALETASEQRTALQTKLSNAATEERTIREGLQTLVQQSHKAEMDRARADSRRASAIEQLFEEYNLDPQEAHKQVPEGGLPPDAAQTVSKLRRELRSLGDVNLGAIEAYDRLTERADILGAQRADILGGIEQIRESIRELDLLTRDRFSSTFEAVASAFTQTFDSLFAGGEGRLSLTDPTNMLETGVEIEVTLPGKKRQRLELLSGGERSLCATAFLFSLLKVKPSPLVVLDEVDAPLDGRNVERFISLLKEFTMDTRFLIVTHNPATVEAAPVWLGVTMQEPGVSTLVPAKAPVQPMAVVVT